MRGAAAARKRRRQQQQIGNTKNAKARIHMRGAEAERQAEAARNIFCPARGSGSCRRRGALATEKGPEKGVVEFPPKFSQNV